MTSSVFPTGKRSFSRSSRYKCFLKCERRLLFSLHLCLFFLSSCRNNLAKSCYDREERKWRTKEQKKTGKKETHRTFSLTKACTIEWVSSIVIFSLLLLLWICRRCSVVVICWKRSEWHHLLDRKISSLPSCFFDISHNGPRLSRRSPQPLILVKRRFTWYPGLA